MLEAEGVTCYGVLAPGVWETYEDLATHERAFEKLGIDNVLLPQHDRIRFALRRDLAQEQGRYHPESQAGQAQLGWHIFDDAINVVNQHFAHIASLDKKPLQKGMLIIDELGRLELMRGEGLTEAVSLLEHGPTACFQDALLVVRDTLVSLAEERFTAWGGCQRIAPDEASEHLVLKTLS